MSSHKQFNYIKLKNENSKGNQPNSPNSHPSSSFIGNNEAILVDISTPDETNNAICTSIQLPTNNKSNPVTSTVSILDLPIPGEGNNDIYKERSRVYRGDLGLSTEF